MSDEYEDNEPDDEDQQGNQDIRNLRKKAKAHDDLASQLQASRKELAFAKAKLDLDDPRIGYFIKGYEGDLTTEAIRERAEADGFLAKQQQDTTALQGQQRIANASSGAGETPNPDLADLIGQAQSPEEVMKIMDQAGYPTSWSR